MPLSPWLPFIVSLAVVVIGLALHGVAFAFFLGRMKQKQESDAALDAERSANHARMVGILSERLEQFGKAADDYRTSAATLNLRLEGVERQSAMITPVRDDLIRLSERWATGAERRDLELSRLGREITAIHRILGNLAAGRFGKLVEFPLAEDEAG